MNIRLLLAGLTSVFIGAAAISAHAAPVTQSNRNLEAGQSAQRPLPVPDSPVMIAQADISDFPGGKPITIIVPYAAGGVTDTAGRWMATALEKELNTPVQVVNVVGAAGQVALTQLMQSRPDGYTIGYAILPNAITHYLDPSRNAAYTLDNFETIANHHLAGILLAVRSDSPYQTLGDLIEAARANPGKITVSDSGLLANPHLQLMVLEHTNGVKFASTHFNGGAPSVAALLGGHVEVLAASTADVLSHVRAGDFRVLGVATEEPDPFLPDAPTMKSLGFDIVLPAVTGLAAPKGTPKERVDILSNAIRAVVESEEHRKQLVDFGLVPHYLDAEAFREAWIANEDSVRPVLESVDIAK